MKTYDLTSKEIVETELPASVFAQEVNEALLAQAVRVYRARLRQGNANTKTRGEVAGSTRKIYKQKGTGRARHGSIKAPVFVGGGTVHGPRAHDFDLELNTKMKRKALVCALSAKAQRLAGITGVSDFDGRTADVNTSLKELLANQKKTLLVVCDANVTAFRNAVNNIPWVETVPAVDVSAYDVLRYENVVIDTDALPVLVERLSKIKKEVSS